jgi:succinate dehydrogenase / fumarate reductase cytochrome b subunit
VADNPFRAYDIVAGEFRNIVILIVYMIGIAATVWHFANGLWLFAVDWGIVIGERAQRLMGYACIAFGVFLLAVGINAELAFVWKGGLLGRILY